MAKNITNANHMRTFEWTNDTGADISGDAIVVVGDTGDAILAVALDDIADGDTGVLGTECEVTADKVSGAVFAQGESLNWDASASAFDDNQAAAAAGDVSGPASSATADGEDGDTECSVWLTGIPGTLAS